MSASPAFIGGPTGPGRAAPGPGGYVLAVVVADVVAALLATAYLASGGDAGYHAVLLVFAVAYVTTLSVPCALVGAPLLHLLVRRSRSQALHVLVLGAAGALVGWLVDAALFVGGYPLLPRIVGVSTAAGRGALVPAVRRARERVASGVRPTAMTTDPQT